MHTDIYMSHYNFTHKYNNFVPSLNPRPLENISHFSSPCPLPVLDCQQVPQAEKQQTILEIVAWISSNILISKYNLQHMPHVLKSLLPLPFL